MVNRISLISFILIIFSLNAFASRVPKIKIKIGKSLKKVTIKGTDITKELPILSKRESLAGRRVIQFNCKKSKGTKINKPVLLASLKSQTGVLKWDEIPYQGEFQITVSHDKNSCDLIHQTNLEDYLATLLSREMNSKWPIEALKAQAVAARSYALFKMKHKVNTLTPFYDLENSEKHQVGGALMDKTKKTANATNDTKGEILVTKKTKKQTPVFFHSKCGGRTLTPEKVWANKISGYKERTCPFCHNHGRKVWKTKISKSKFANYLDRILSKYYSKKPTKKSGEFLMVPDRKFKRKISYYKKGERNHIKKADLRKLLGRKKVPSNNFKIDMHKNHVELIGEGYGHGVGLCQFGAFELAKRGYTYKQILAYYFPNHVIKKVY